jgi:transcriptional regulator with XRE-family HTH domain
MSTLAMIEPIEAVAYASDDAHLYISLIQQAMTERDVSLRALALKANISKSRLGRILHSNPEERQPVTLNEFQALLRALEIDIVQAIIKVETIRDQKVLADERYVALIAMLTSLFKGLPSGLVEALAEIDGLDGSEVRKEWAPHLQMFVIKRMVHEVTRVMQRREQIFEDRL